MLRSTIGRTSYGGLESSRLNESKSLKRRTINSSECADVSIQRDAFEILDRKKALTPDKNDKQRTASKPNQNAFIERFNRTFREDVLTHYFFEDLEQVKNLTGKFIWQYNNIRPHDSLQYLTPRAFLLKYGKLSITQADQKLHTFQQDSYDDQKEILLDSHVTT
jgi:hypothetical protein